MFDDQVKNVLLAGGHATPDQLRAWQQQAASTSSSVYEVALSSGAVDEAALVSDLSDQLGIPSVSLTRFRAKPDLQRLVPRWLVEQFGVLPVGLKDREGTLTLFVAMVDPLDMDALEAIAVQVSHPIVALLAGPIDLAAAIGRVYAGSEALPATQPTGPIPPPPSASRGTVPSPPMPAQLPRGEGFGEDSGENALFEGLAGRAEVEKSAALSLLDDIPRDRHEVDTSPSGFINIPELADSDIPDANESGIELLAMANSDPGLLSELGIDIAPSSAASRAVFDALNADATGLGLPVGDDVGFRRRPSDADKRSDWRDQPTDRLVRALIALMLKRGLVTTDELSEYLRD